MSNERLIVAGPMALAAALAFGGVAHAQQERELELDVGEQTTISAVGVERYSEGVPNVVQVRVTEREFIIVALRPGQTSLVLFYMNGRRVTYDITVRDPDAVEDARPGSVDERENIRLDLYFVELSETYSHQIGVGFPGAIGGQGVGNANLRFDFLGTPMDRTPQFTQASLQLVNQVLPRIDLAQSAGWARLRRQAMVVTANATPARFNTGGEVNIAVTGSISAEIRTIEFGSEVRMTPRFDAQTGRIEIQLRADLSELTEPQNPGGPPGRRRTRLQSVVNLQPGQAMMMSGIVSRSEQETQGGLPGLSQIPIIGVLFGSNARRGEATQNVLFIVPTIVQAVPRRQRNYIEEALETFERFNGFIHDVEMFERTPPGYGRPGGRAPAPGGARGGAGARPTQ
ncbi:MAG TPA: pilus assembly protein N-terminal domain-containing protein [Sandaracinaceae bacterium LLY-WYZ-13_1]|nr:pilus assembly protein N-terminal domain-containing protein [Sandaracinaceae bacterium LLY-WYZ-13_1]